MTRPSLLVVALLSITLLSLEVAWTRIFSAEFFHPFAFLILSLAVLGLGVGALAVRMFPRLSSDRMLALALCLTGLAAVEGPVLVFAINPHFSELFRSWALVGKLALTILILSSAYFFGGMALATIFKRAPRALPRLYMADLLGAGAGVVAVVVAMNVLGTPMATALCALPVVAAALLVSRGVLRLLPVALMAGMVVVATQADELLAREREERAPIIYTHWDAVAKVKIFDFGEGYRGLNIDNLANSPVYGFDGNWDRPDSMQFEFGIDVKYLIDRFDDCTFLSLGAGGGVDVLQALQWGATDIHAVEVVPHINTLMTTGELADFSGHIYDDPRVTVVTEDGRAYVRRFRDTFDVIYSLSSNTFAAMTSGAFALAENYLFTTEAFADYWRALSPDGFMMMEHQFYTPRTVSEVKDALRNLGVADPLNHFAVYDLPSRRRNIILLSRQPLTDEIRQHAFRELAPERWEEIHLLYPAPDSIATNLINRIVLNGWEAEADSATIALSPTTDDRPYVAQMGLWRNLSWESLDRIPPYEVYGFPLAKLLILVITGVVVVLALPLTLLPYLGKGPKLPAVPWLYFLIIGMAYLAVEVMLIQKYACFVGTTVASLLTVLLTLLVMSGLGSRVAPRVDNRVAFGMIVGWLILDAVAFGFVTRALGHLTLVPRIAVTAAWITPVGFFMGMPFPKGGLPMGSLIDWGFAVNGVGSVLGSTLILLVAFDLGFRVAILACALLYAVSYTLLSASSRWAVAEAVTQQRERVGPNPSVRSHVAGLPS